MNKLIKKYSGGGSLGVIEVALPEYSVSTGYLGDRRLGHSAVIAVDESNGRTRTGVYGRYDKDNLGMALREILPDIKLTKEGTVSDEDLEKYAPVVLNAIQKLEGADKVGDEIMLRYYPGVSYADAVNTMLNAEKYGLRNSDGTPAYYDWFNGITCASYAHNIATGQNPATPHRGWSSRLIRGGNEGGNVVTYAQNEGTKIENTQNDENSGGSLLGAGIAKIAAAGIPAATRALKAKHTKNTQTVNTQRKSAQRSNTQNNVGVLIYRRLRNLYNNIRRTFK